MPDLLSPGRHGQGDDHMAEMGMKVAWCVTLKANTRFATCVLPIVVSCLLIQWLAACLTAARRAV